MLDNLINERAADGWELVTYDYMATSMQIKGAFVVTFRKEKDDIFTQSSTNLFETLDVRYSITDKKELENSKGFGNYSIRAEEDNSYVISIGDCRFITIRFNIEEAKGRLHGGCGAASNEGQRLWDPPRYEHKSGMVIPRYANIGENCGSA